MGIISEEQRDFSSAETWYRKSLAIFEKFNDAHSQAIVERSLVRLAELQKQDSEGDDSEDEAFTLCGHTSQDTDMTTIEQLDDSAAVRILDTLRQHALNTEESVTECPAELRQALQAEFGAPTELSPASEGDMARAALTLLAEDPQLAANIQVMISQPAARDFGSVETALVVTACLIALQTHVRFHRQKDGQWTFTIDKPSGSESLIAKLAQKLLTHLTGIN